jgi:hypothetical protein
LVVRYWRRPVVVPIPFESSRAAIYFYVGERIWLNIAGDVEHALTAQGLNGGKRREVWFLDDLIEGGVCRCRCVPPGPLSGCGESTIALRTPALAFGRVGDVNSSPRGTARPRATPITASKADWSPAPNGHDSTCLLGCLVTQ